MAARPTTHVYPLQILAVSHLVDGHESRKVAAFPVHDWSLNMVVTDTLQQMKAGKHDGTKRHLGAVKTTCAHSHCSLSQQVIRAEFSPLAVARRSILRSRGTAVLSSFLGKHENDT